MKNYRGFGLGLVMGLALALSSIGFAQTGTQTDPARTKESCCAATSCCSGDSCAIKHDATGMSKEHSSKSRCCCCGDESCDMKMKDHQDKHNKKQG